jgi:imidazolonepropionase-like amidohydrolase
VGYLIDNARIINGVGGVRESAFLVVDGSKIAAIGSVDHAPLTTSLERIDAAGRTVMPGVIDCHVHLSINGVPNAIAEALRDTDALAVLRMLLNATRTLAAGVTTVRDLGAKNHIDVSFRQALHEGVSRRSPRLVLSGRPITRAGGHLWQVGRQASGVDDVRRAAREQIKVGVDWIKIIATGGILTEGTESGSSQFDEEEMRVAVEEAHKAGRLAAVHAHGAAGIKTAVRAGVDTVEHGYFLDDEGAQLMLGRGCFLVPTVTAVRLIVEHGVEGGIPGDVVRKAASAVDSQAETCRKAWRAGVKLAMGTNAGAPYNRHGGNMQELEAMVGIGLSPMEAIIMATSGSAQLLRMDDRIGTVETGKEADLLVVNGDPLEDIAILQDKVRIAYVFQAGEIVAQEGQVVEP